MVNCDNGKNFVGAHHELQELKARMEKEEKSLRTFALETGFEFGFIPPQAPHFGGLWEAAVKAAKGLLLRTVGNANLTAEELSTMLVEVEAVLNSRPLTAQSSDPNDGEALTPGHFLIGEPLRALPADSSPDIASGCLRRWRHVSSLKQQFWRLWSRDYLR